ncbi:hypothetical protein OG800_50000 (plasmid) [Streptomyces sp. NBC_00445]|uniref:hypothetical protein n=1 Tax=Streptomyces sp. NBC_00445 TaxID=2975745 RepID=UPI002E1A5496
MDRLITPYLTPWTGEDTSPTPVTVTVSGVAYTIPVQDALPRDLHGVLWTLCQGAASGKPAYAAKLHPERQKTPFDVAEWRT